MLATTPYPLLPPTPSTITSSSPQNVLEPVIAVPPPTSSRGPKSHQRARTAIDLPPLFTRTPSSSPTRSSTFLPFLKHSRDRSISPERVTAREAAEFEIAGTPPEEIPDPSKAAGRVNRLASWFEGTSDPINITLAPSPVKEKPNPIWEPEMSHVFSSSSDSVDTYTRRPQKRPALGSNLAAETSTSRFSFFRKASQSQLSTSATAADELAQLDPFEALFPHGQSDIFSPSSFKNLQMNAEGVVRRFQEAYKQNMQALRTVTSQKNVQADELVAAQTSNEYLKEQLTEMAEKVSDQEELIAALRAELSSKLASFEGEPAPRRSVRMVSGGSGNEFNPAALARQSSYRKKRISDTSTLNDSENGSEMSSAISLFSDVTSGSCSPGTSIAASPVLKHSIMLNRPYLQPSPIRDAGAPIQVLECHKCHNTSPSEAWDVIGLMKMEKLALKERIEQLEGASDGALDILSGLSLS